jgi:hypothetical protein
MPLFSINRSLLRLSGRVLAAGGEQHPVGRVYQPRSPALYTSDGTCPIVPHRHTVVNALAESAGAQIKVI